jgi:hypothetical protein
MTHSGILVHHLFQVSRGCGSSAPRIKAEALDAPGTVYSQIQTARRHGARIKALVTCRRAPTRTSGSSVSGRALRARTQAGVHERATLSAGLADHNPLVENARGTQGPAGCGPDDQRLPTEKHPAWPSVLPSAHDPAQLTLAPVTVSWFTVNDPFTLHKEASGRVTVTNGLGMPLTMPVPFAA